MDVHRAEQQRREPLVKLVKIHCRLFLSAPDKILRFQDKSAAFLHGAHAVSLEHRECHKEPKKSSKLTAVSVFVQKLFALYILGSTKTPKHRKYALQPYPATGGAVFARWGAFYEDSRTQWVIDVHCMAHDSAKAMIT